MPYPPISALPTPPSRNSPSNFSALMDAFLAAFPQFRSEVNALAAYLDTLSLQAGATIASSPTDATLGRLPVFLNYQPNQPGNGLPWGLGASHAIDVPGNDANAITRSGFYRVATSSTVANVPDTLFGGVIVHHPYSAFYSAQTFIMTNAANAGRFWVRHCTNGTWAAWRRVYTQRDVLGTVSQDSGVPTGALIERGSNANGSYTRWADGTQICWNAAGITTNPAAFSDTPVSIDSNKLRIGRWF